MRLLPRPALARLALQQFLLVGVLATVMVVAHRLTGRTLRGLADAPTAGDLLLYASTVAVLVALSRAIAGQGAPPGALGLRPTRRRLAEAAIGFAIGALANAIPWALALWRGDAVVSARLGEHVPVSWAPIALGMVIACANAWFEEATSRAAPLVILRYWQPWRAVALSAVCFALMHGIGESLEPGRLAYLFALGVILAFVWLGRGNVWLGAGLHAGWFWSSLVPSGRFRSGAWFAIDGQVGAYVIATDVVLLALALGALAVLARRSPGSVREEQPAARARSR